MAGEKKIFAVMAADNPEKLGLRIAAEFSDSYLVLAPGQWLLVGPSSMTTQELAKKISVSVDDPVSAAIILSVNSYYGRASLNIWEWLTAKMGDTSAIAG